MKISKNKVKKIIIDIIVENEEYKKLYLDHKTDGIEIDKIQTENNLLEKILKQIEELK